MGLIVSTMQTIHEHLGIMSDIANSYRGCSIVRIQIEHISLKQTQFAF